MVLMWSTRLPKRLRTSTTVASSSTVSLAAPSGDPAAAQVSSQDSGVSAGADLITTLFEVTTATDFTVTTELSVTYPTVGTNSTIIQQTTSRYTPSVSTGRPLNFNCTDYDNDLFWIKVGLFSAAGVSLIMLCCMSSILALVYCAYYKWRDGESSIDIRSRRQQSLAQPIEDGFKRLTVRREETNEFGRQRQNQFPALDRPNASPGNSPGPGVSGTFSAHMAPPVPKSGAHLTAVGVSPAEETPIRKGALDRIEQEEAKRHSDMMLMNDKRASADPSGKSRQQKSRSRSKVQAKNPTFVVDKNTLKLVRVDGRSSKDMSNPQQQGGKGGAVEIPFKF